MHLVSVFMHNNEGAYLTPPLNVVVVVFLQTILMATLAIGGKQWPLQLEIPKYKNTCEGQGSWSPVWPPHRRPCRGLCSPAVGIVSSYISLVEELIFVLCTWDHQRYVSYRIFGGQLWGEDIRGRLTGHKHVHLKKYFNWQNKIFWKDYNR